MKHATWSSGLVVSGDGRGVVAHAGVVAIRVLADRVGLTAALSTATARRGLVPEHDRGQVLVDVATMLAGGAEAISDIDVLRHHRPVWAADMSWRSSNLRAWSPGSVACGGIGMRHSPDETPWRGLVLAHPLLVQPKVGTVLRRGSGSENAKALIGLAGSATAPGFGEAVRAIPKTCTQTLAGKDTGVSRGRMILTLAGAAYVASPLDFVPEALLGPLGLGDDGLVAVAVIMYLLSSARTYLRHMEGANRAPGASSAG